MHKLCAGCGLGWWCCLMLLAPIALWPLRSDAASQIPVLNWTQRSDWVNIKTSYHAQGDGVADDTAAIQQALDGAAAGATLYIPPGTYKVSATLNLKGSAARNGITLLGHGRATTLVWQGAAGADFFAVDGNSHGRYWGLTLDGRGLAGCGFHHKSSALAETGVSYRNVALRNLRRGIWGEGGGAFSSREVSFENCVFDGCGTGIIMTGKDESAWTMAGCDLVHCTEAGIACRGGGCAIRDCFFEANGTVDLDLAAEHGVSVRRCKSTGSAQFISNSSANSPLTVQDCYITGWTGKQGAITDIATTPLFLAFSRFDHAPDNLAPVRLGQAAPIIDCDNAETDQARLYDAPAACKFYKIEGGNYPPVVGGSGGARITTFVDDTVAVPAAIFDAATDFGARGDGQADDTAAVQKAIDAARAKGGGALAYLPRGTYKISAPLKVSGSDYVIGGSGGATRLLWAGPEGGTMVAVDSPRNITLQNLALGPAAGGQGTASIDIDQTYSEGLPAASIAYDGIEVGAGYAKQQPVGGLRLNGLDSRSVVILNRFEGNIRLHNSAGTTVMDNISGGGGITIDDKLTNQPWAGLLGFQTRYDGPGSNGLAVHDSKSLVLSDWFRDSCVNGLSLGGSDGDQTGRVTIGSPNTSLAADLKIMAIDNYSGTIAYGPSSIHAADAKVQSITQKGANAVDVLLLANSFGDSVLSYALQAPNAHVDTIANWSSRDSAKPPADSSTDTTQAQLAAACDDLQHLGFQDLNLNYPFIIKAMGI